MSAFLLRSCALFLGLVFRALPLRAGLACGRFIGWFVYRILGIRRDEVRARLVDRLGPEAAALTPRTYAHLGMCLVELLRLQRSQQLAGWVRVRGREHFDAAVGRGRGVLILTAHLGNWDLLACSQALSGVPLAIITRDVHARGVDELWKQKRQHLGLLQLPVDGPGNARRVLRHLRSGGAVGFVLDQHAGSDGVVVDFLGKAASTHAGLANLALATDAPVLPVFIHRDPDGTHQVEVCPPVALQAAPSRDEVIRRTTAKYAEVIGEAVRRHPEQWLWLHRRWKVPVHSEPATDARAKAAA